MDWDGHEDFGDLEIRDNGELRDALLKKKGKKRGHCPYGAGGGQPQFLF